ncbi:MAG: hydrogenase iron-sulfur subunit [Dehalococcoidales bacterium]|nr:hydrogenase iron-sulfur subunit [Dehalococcoidales bacterium]
MNNSATIVVFVCNWDGLSCVETAAQQKMNFPASVKIIRVSCLSRVHTGLMLKALEMGADGVMLLGCENNNCHFGVEESLVDRNVEKSRDLMKLLGLKEDRLALVRLQQADAAGFINHVNDFAGQLAGAAAGN